MRWKRINKKKLPKTGLIIAGSFRDGEWDTSSASSHGYAAWFDPDRTHYLRLPTPPRCRRSDKPDKSE